MATEEGARRRVAIIGAGINGLACIKSCLEEGLQPFCFEQFDNIGGTWYYSEKPRKNQGAAVFATTTTNNDTKTMSFSDFPMPDSAARYQRHAVYLEYLHAYARHFDLMKHIALNATVVRIKRTDDYDATGRWHVTTSSNGAERTETFDAVAVCTGYLRHSIIPAVEGLEDFPGTVMPMKDYRTADIFKDKRVLVVGNSYSAGDMAAESADQAKQTYLSIGRGAWLLARMPVGSRGFDLVPRWLQYTLGMGPYSMTNYMLRDLGMKTIDMPYYGLGGIDYMPDGPMLISDTLPFHVVSGKVVIKPRLVKFNKSRAEFSDGSHEDIDLVVFATGYRSDYSFIHGCNNIPEAEQHAPQGLYKRMYPIDLPHPTLSFHGAVITNTAHCVWLELQSRLMARVVSGKHKLPTNEEMQKDYKRRVDTLPAKKAIHLWTLDYADELAQELGVFPSFWSMFVRSPMTALRVMMTPPIGVHYRLLGPGSADWAWQEATEAYHKIKSMK